MTVDPEMTKGNFSHSVVEISNLFSGASHKDLLINPHTVDGCEIRLSHHRSEILASDSVPL